MWHKGNNKTYANTLNFIIIKPIVSLNFPIKESNDDSSEYLAGRHLHWFGGVSTR